MSELLILGAGGHGKVVAEAARDGGDWRRIAFLDDRHPDLDHVLDWPVLGRCEDAADLRADFTHAAVAIGDAGLRLAWLERLAALGYRLDPIVHPSASISRSARLDAGVVVLAQAAINAGAIVGRGSIVNTGASVDHDCLLGEGVHVCPGARIAGEVRIGDGSWIGIGASVVQCLTIGRGVTVGAGAAVIADVADDLTVVGVPARELRSS